MPTISNDHPNRTNVAIQTLQIVETLERQIEGTNCGTLRQTLLQSTCDLIQQTVESHPLGRSFHSGAAQS